MNREFRFEPTERHIHVRFEGHEIARTSEALLLLGGYVKPRFELGNYGFPRADVKDGILIENARRETDDRGGSRYFDVVLGDRTLTDGAWTFDEPTPAFEGLRDHVIFDWNAMDSWWEEDEQVFVHPRSPYHRVDALRSSRTVRVSHKGVELASTDRPVLCFETDMPTRYYVPRADVQLDLLTPTETHTQCPYKGVADYFSADVAGETLKDIAWTYPMPVPECPKIEQHVAFFAEHLDVEVDGTPLGRPTTKWTDGIPDRDLI